MQSIQDAVGHFGQGARILEESMARIVECWSQMERAQLAQRSSEERWRQMEERLGTVMEDRWRQFEDRLERMMMDRVETLVRQRLQEMVVEGVEAKFGERLDRVEQKLWERDGDRETGEASGPAEVMGRLADGEVINNRLSALESSVQRALEVMFPRVEVLLSKLEEQSLSFQIIESSPEPRVSSPSLPSSPSCAAPQPFHSPFHSPPVQPSSHCVAENASYAPNASRVCFSSDILIRAAKEGRTGEVEMQLDAGISINACDSYGNTALYWAAFRGHGQTVSYLIERGADVNCRNNEGWTPLHAAARWGLTTCISLLLDAGASIESKTESGRTPLHVAANSGREQSVHALLVEGARINAKDNEGKTPLDLANSSTVRRLLRH